MATYYRNHTPISGGETHLQCIECYAFDRNHNQGCSSRRPFPIQKGGTIPWWLAEIAYEWYNKQYPGQSLEMLAERGGFGPMELVGLIRREL